jgi:hypothetical protein
VLAAQESITVEREQVSVERVVSAYAAQARDLYGEDLVRHGTIRPNSSKAAS